MRRRLGQGGFQAVVLDAYQARCAITGHRIRPTLQAAHIRPVTADGPHSITNGLLLRSDVHTMFDRGYLSLDTHLRLLVSPRLREEFGNGEEFYRIAGDPIAAPPGSPTGRPASTWSGTATWSTRPAKPCFLEGRDRVNKGCRPVNAPRRRSARNLPQRGPGFLLDSTRWLQSDDAIPDRVECVDRDLGETGQFVGALETADMVPGLDHGAGLLRAGPGATRGTLRGHG